MESWSIEVDKDYLKFSAAHFLIFPDGSAERLHGHNYKVYVEIGAGLDEHGLVLNFKQIKPLVKRLLDGLDEHMLVPGRHPVLTCRQHDPGSVEVRYRERRYLLPVEDVVVLPICNTSAENLATWVGSQLRKEIEAHHPRVRIGLLRVMVEETPGQRGVFHWVRD
jgi:6-pyruvoyltetrahydropterin/6-carboxytetrahydropterin synthase